MIPQEIRDKILEILDTHILFIVLGCMWIFFGFILSLIFLSNIEDDYYLSENIPSKKESGLHSTKTH